MEKSLVRPADGRWAAPRYGFPGPIRQYALEQLAAASEVLQVISSSPGKLEPVSFPKIISAHIDDVARPGSEWLQWRQTVGRLDGVSVGTTHISIAAIA